MLVCSAKHLYLLKTPLNLVLVSFFVGFVLERRWHGIFWVIFEQILLERKALPSFRFFFFFQVH